MSVWQDWRKCKKNKRIFLMLIDLSDKNSRSWGGGNIVNSVDETPLISLRNNRVVRTHGDDGAIKPAM